MKKVNKILVSQPAPANFEKSPYAELVKKHDVEFVFQKFFKIVGVSAIEFRKNRINILEHCSVILMSKNAVDHYFRMAKEMRIEVPDDMKYFCLNESIALYLQKYVAYRKRKIFFSKNHVDGMLDIVSGKHKNGKFLIPCADKGTTQINTLLNQKNILYSKAIMFENVPELLNEKIKIDDFQLLVLFSPSGVESLIKNFPQVKETRTYVGVLGKNVAQLIKEKGFNLVFEAPTPEAPSITTAIDLFLTKQNKSIKNNI